MNKLKMIQKKCLKLEETKVPPWIACRAMTPNEWLEQRFAELVEFLMQVPKINNCSSEKDLGFVCKIIELM